jgi:hypothetical protein
MKQKSFLTFLLFDLFTVMNYHTRGLVSLDSGEPPLVQGFASTTKEFKGGGICNLSPQFLIELQTTKHVRNLWTGVPTFDFDLSQIRYFSFCPLG